MLKKHIFNFRDYQKMSIKLNIITEIQTGAGIQ